ncbi:hypothetical protein CDAR_172401 [Caerostris darwini]|uniref:Uncharacterized protein n=1 Tax=Caerostris darwini TaxID=1538125 RepID=A0AAV4MH28_9ARAC|nr:hypothetical protein CDAR_172401 [Caerostris darwini]
MLGGWRKGDSLRNTRWRNICDETSLLRVLKGDSSCLMMEDFKIRLPQILGTIAFLPSYHTGGCGFWCAANFFFLFHLHQVCLRELRRERITIYPIDFSR